MHNFLICAILPPAIFSGLTDLLGRIIRSWLMDLGLSEIQQMLKNSAREFLSAECPLTLARAMEEDVAFVLIFCVPRL